MQDSSIIGMIASNLNTGFRWPILTVSLPGGPWADSMVAGAAWVVQDGFRWSNDANPVKRRYLADWVAVGCYPSRMSQSGAFSLKRTIQRNKSLSRRNEKSRCWGHRVTCPSLKDRWNETEPKLPAVFRGHCRHVRTKGKLRWRCCLSPPDT